MAGQTGESPSAQYVGAVPPRRNYDAYLYPRRPHQTVPDAPRHKRVFAKLLEGPATAAEIAQAIDKPKAEVSARLGELVKMGFATVAGVRRRASGSGKQPSTYEVVR